MAAAVAMAIQTSIDLDFYPADARALEQSVRRELDARGGAHTPPPISVPTRLAHTLRALGAAHTPHLAGALGAILGAYDAGRGARLDASEVVARNSVLFLSTVAALDLASASAGTATSAPARELGLLQQLALGRLRALLATTDALAFAHISCVGGQSEAELLVLVVGSISAFRLQSIASELLRLFASCASGEICAPARERQLLCDAIGSLRMLPGSELQHADAGGPLSPRPAEWTSADVVGALSRVLLQRRLGVLKHPVAHAACDLLLPLADSSPPPAVRTGAPPVDADWRVDPAWRAPLDALVEKASAWLRKRKHRHVGARLLACALCVADAQLFWSHFALAQSRLIEAVVEAEDAAVRTELHTAMRALLGRYLRLVAAGREPLAAASAGAADAMLAPTHIFLLLQRLCVHAALRNHAATAALLGVPPVGREKPLVTPTKAGTSAGRPALRAGDANVVCALDLSLDSRKSPSSARALGRGAHASAPSPSVLEAELAARAALLAAVGEARPDFFAQGVALPCLHAGAPLPLDVIAVLLGALASLLDGERHTDVSRTVRQDALDALFAELPRAAGGAAHTRREQTHASEALRAWLPAIGAALAKAWLRLELPSSGALAETAIPPALASSAHASATSARTPGASPRRRAPPADAVVNGATVGRSCLAALLRLTAHCWPAAVPRSAVCRVLCEAALSDERVLVDGASRALRAWLDDAARAPAPAVAVAPSEAVRAFVQLCERSDVDCLDDAGGAERCQHAARELAALVEAAAERRLRLGVRALCEACACAIDWLVLDVADTRAIALRVLRAVRAGYAQAERGAPGRDGRPSAGLSFVLAELVDAVEELELHGQLGAASTPAADPDSPALRVVAVLARALARSHDGADELAAREAAVGSAEDSDEDCERECAGSTPLALAAWRFASGRFSRLHAQAELSTRREELRGRWRTRAASLCTLAGVGFALGGGEALEAKRAVRALFAAAATAAPSAQGALDALARLPLSPGALQTALVEALWLLTPPGERGELARCGADGALDACAAHDVAPAAMRSPHGALALLLPTWQSAASAAPKRPPSQRELLAASAMRSRLLALADAIGRTLCSMLSQQAGARGDGVEPDATGATRCAASLAGQLVGAHAQLGLLAVAFAERVMRLLEAQADALATAPPNAQPQDQRFMLGSRAARNSITAADSAKADAAAIALGLPALSAALCALVGSVLTPLVSASARGDGLDGDGVAAGSATPACDEAATTAARRVLQRTWPRVWQLMLGDHGAPERIAAGAASAAPWMTMPTPAGSLASATDAMCAVLRAQGVCWLWPAVPPPPLRHVAVRLCSMPLAHEPELLRAGTELLRILARNSPADFVGALAEECYGAEPHAPAAAFEALACIALESALSLRPLGESDAASSSAVVLAAALWALGSPSAATRSRAALVCAHAAGRPAAEGHAPAAHQLHQLRLHAASDERAAAAQALAADMLACACPHVPEMVAVEALGRLGALVDAPPLRRRREGMLRCIHILVAAAAAAAARRSPAAPLSPALLHALSRLPAAVGARCGPDEGAVVGERAATLWRAIATPLASHSAALAVVLAGALSTAAHDASTHSPLGARPWLAAAVAVSTVNEEMTCALLWEILRKHALGAAGVSAPLERADSLCVDALASVAPLSAPRGSEERAAPGWCDAESGGESDAADAHSDEDESWSLAACVRLAPRTVRDGRELDVFAGAPLELLPPSPPPSPPLPGARCSSVPSPPSHGWDGGAPWMVPAEELPFAAAPSSPVSMAPSPHPLDTGWQALLDDFPPPPSELPPPPPVSALTHLTLDRPSPARFARRNTSATRPSTLVGQTADRTVPPAEVAPCIDAGLQLTGSGLCGTAACAVADAVEAASAVATGAGAPVAVDADAEDAADLVALGALARREAAARYEAAERAELAARAEAAARAEMAARSAARAAELAAHHSHMAAVARGQADGSPPASGHHASRSPLAPLAAYQVGSSSQLPAPARAAAATEATLAAAKAEQPVRRFRPSCLRARSAYELPDGLALPPAGRALCASVEILSNNGRAWALARPELSARILWAALDQAFDAQSRDAREVATRALDELTMVFEASSDPSRTADALSRLVPLVSECAARCESADLARARSRAAEVHAELQSAVDSLASALDALLYATGQSDALFGSFEHVAAQAALAFFTPGRERFSCVSQPSIRHELLCALARSRPLELLPDDDAIARRCGHARALLRAAGAVASERRATPTSPASSGQIQARLLWIARLVETARALLALAPIGGDGRRIALSEPAAASVGRARCAALRACALVLELRSPDAWAAAAWLVADTLGALSAHTYDERAAAAQPALEASGEGAGWIATDAGLRGVANWMSSNCGRLQLALLRGLSDHGTLPAAASALRSLWAWLPPLRSEAALVLPGIPSALALTRALGMSERAWAQRDERSSAQASGSWGTSFELHAYLRRSGARLGAGARAFDMRRALCALGGDAADLGASVPGTQRDADRAWARGLAALCGADGPEHALASVASLLRCADELANITPAVESLCGAALELGCAMLAERAEASARGGRSTSPRGTGAAALWDTLLNLREGSRLAHARVITELVQLIAQTTDPKAPTTPNVNAATAD